MKSEFMHNQEETVDFEIKMKQISLSILNLHSLLDDDVISSMSSETSDLLCENFVIMLENNYLTEEIHERIIGILTDIISVNSRLNNKIFDIVKKYAVKKTEKDISMNKSSSLTYLYALEDIISKQEEEIKKSKKTPENICAELKRIKNLLNYEDSSTESSGDIFDSKYVKKKIN